MAVSTVFTGRLVLPDRRIILKYNGSTEIEFQDIDECRNWAQGPDTDIDLARRMCAAYAFARSSDLSNINTVLNKTFTFDLSAPNPIRVQ